MAQTTEDSVPSTHAAGGTEGKEEQTKAEMQERTEQAKDQAKEKAQEVGSRAQSAIREQVDTRSTEAGHKVTATAGDIGAVGDELRKQGREAPARFAEQAAARGERLGRYLQESDADRILVDVENFGRRQPMAVLAGGLLLGFAAARFLKASSRDRYYAGSSR